MCTSARGSTSIARAISAQPLSSSTADWLAPSVHARVEKKCVACCASGTHESASCKDARRHSKALCGDGSIISLMSNIIGIGLDATDIPRIAATLKRFGDRFTHRIFSDAERAYCLRRRHPEVHFAGRFAAKEAAMKAL